mgnify:CR=1 FL=1
MTEIIFLAEEAKVKVVRLHFSRGASRGMRLPRDVSAEELVDSKNQHDYRFIAALDLLPYQ